ncbi:hypothetical protein KTS45_12465 [Halomicroarcula limicola]|uniref:Uncharacterized protein n=1 Tax=Haloarcula limicola TaxID=1429915 RepID=A0A8J7Y5P6_9EURY|nr:hypothetical protein [Halomicroarcula limicola]MBV0925010.1 hypothetical protein [Halomicroarcula limicola]
MSGEETPDPDELVVRASYRLPINPEEEDLSGIQEYLRFCLQQDGFIHADIDLEIWEPAPRSMTFHADLPNPNPSIFDKLKQKFSLSSEREFNNKSHLTKLSNRRPDLPYSIIFHFVPVHLEDGQEFELQIESEPTALQQYRQGVLSESRDYDEKNVAHTNKRQVRQISSRLGLQALRQPYIVAEFLEPTIAPQQRDVLEKSEYGATATQYIDEADKCFQRRDFRAALNCYILAIEWLIISYFENEVDRDLLEEEEQRQDIHGGFQLYHLVDYLDDENIVSTTTIDKLESWAETERHWMAHHKFGEMPREDIYPIKKRTEVLSKGLFPEIKSSQ